MYDFIYNKIPGCENFYWREVLFLPRWQIYAIPDETQHINLIRVCNVLQEVRNRLLKPIRVTSALRPPLYNKLIGGAKKSKHIKGMAIDFQVKEQSPDKTRELILPWLEELDLRMEDLPRASWVHIDIAKPLGDRFFEP